MALAADYGCRLLEIDYAGIENALTAYFLWRHNVASAEEARDYLRWCQLGLHAAVCAIRVGEPAWPNWPDDQIKAHLARVKEAHPVEYDICKRVDHGCLPGDHEVLTPEGWVRLDQLADGVPIAQWESGQIMFVTPSQVTRQPVGEGEALVELAGRGLRLAMTHDHRVPVRVGQTERVQEYPAASLPRTGRVPTSGTYYPLAGGIPWSPRLALLVAGQADGHLKATRWVFHLTRPRKIARLRTLLDEAGIAFTDVPCGCHPEGHRLRFQLAPSVWLTQRKTFALSTWLQLSPPARHAFLDEVVLWDGTVGKRAGRQACYLTTIKENAVAVQTIAHLSGRQGLLRDTRRCGMSGNILYSVSLNRRRWARLECLDVQSVPAPDRVFCVTVPSSYFVVRAYDTISITGNTGYGLTPYGMTEMFPDYFKTLKEAQQGQQFLFTLAPSLPKWHYAVRQRARDVGYLGGVTLPPAPPSIWDHPYGYRHWFHDVLSYKPTDEVAARKWLKDPKRAPRIVTLHGRYFRVDYGGDSKRTCAYYPQSTGAGVLKLAELRLFHPESADYIGDAYFGRTPLLHPIHDSLLLHVPNRIYDRVLAICVRVMQDHLRALPIPKQWGMGPFLRIGVAAKGGRTWDARDMAKLPVEPIRFGVEHPDDSPTIAAQESDEETWNALARRIA